MTATRNVPRRASSRWQGLAASLALFALCAATGTAFAQGDLYTGRAYVVGLDPQSIVALHLNDDGQPELITGNTVGGTTLSILFSAGGSSYTEGAAIGGTLDPLQLLAADMNGDGRDDLVTVHSSRVEVWIANGLSILIKTASVDPGGSMTRSAVAGDFNEDGRLDIAAANEFSNTVAVLLGDGAGGLAAPVPFAVNTLVQFNVQPHGVATGDFNEDGHLDLVTANYTYPSTLSVILGDGAGAFGPPSNFVMSTQAGWAGDSVVVGDLNEDGHLDLVTGGYDTIHFGDGTGAFGPPVADVANDRKLLADVNEDGHLDQVYIHIGVVTVARGDGLGGIAGIDSYPIGFMKAVALTDIDGDGHVDLACVESNQSQGDVRLLFNDGAGGFRLPPFTPLGAVPSRLALGDLNGDGVTDVVTANTQAESLCVALGDGAGGFLPSTTIALDAEPNEVAIDDLNGDGHPDLAVALLEFLPPGYPGSVTILFGNGTGAFPTGTVLPMATGPYHVATGDLNEDGVPDVAATSQGSSAATLSWLGDGAGTFAAPQSWAFGKANDADDPNLVALLDMNADGHFDLVTGHDNSERLSIRQGDGSGGFGPQLNYLGLGYAIAIADLDGDGDLDVAGQRQGDALAVRFFTGGGYSPVVTYSAVKGEPSASDLDGDGDLDLVVDTGDYGLRCMLNNGNGGFTQSTKYAAGMSAQAFALADLDGSGFPDIVGVGKGAAPDVPPHVSVQASLTPSAWKNVGHALAGGNGVPQLVGTGTLLPSSPIALTIDQGPPAGSAVLAIGSLAINAPFKGGVFVPVPTVLIFGLPLDASGHFTGAGTWYSSLPSGTSVYFQAWMADPAGPAGYSATNGIKGTTP